MRVLLVRHGIAFEEAPGLGDEGRSLTPEGRNKVRAVAKILSGLAVHPERILASPLVRAVQTAELFAQGLQCEDVAVDARLQPSTSPSRAANIFLDHVDVGCVAAVGHEPLMGLLAAHLLGLPRFPHPFKKAGVCVLILGDSRAPARFEYFVTPAGRVEKDLDQSLGLLK